MTVSFLVADDQTGDFLAAAEEGAKTMDITAGTTTTLEVDTQADSPDGADGTIVVSIVDGAEYALGSTISVSTTVTDPVLPVVSISGPIGVTQGHDYPLTVSLDSAATENLDIAILVSDLARSTDDIVFTGATIAGVTTTGIVVRDADTFTPANGVVQIPSGESSVVVNLTTQESSTSFEGSSITLVTPGAGAKYQLHGSAIRLAPALNNNGNASSFLPSMSIAANRSTVYVGSSGAMAEFTVTASHAPNVAKTVSLMVSEDQDFISSANEGLQSVDFVADEMTAVYRVALADSNTGTDDTDSVVTVRLVDTTHTVLGTNQYSYSLADTGLSATTTATDNEPLPVVSIASTAATSTGTGVTEGHSFTFTVSATEDVSADLVVDLTIPDYSSGGEGESFELALAGGGSSVTILSGTRSISGVINVTKESGTGGIDAGFEVDALISIASAPSKYTLSSNDRIAVTVKDSDEGDADYPLLTLTGPASVVEGATATYTATASHTPSNLPVTVSFLVADDPTGDFLAAGEEGAKTMDITAGTTTTLEVDTQADSPDGADGTIVVSIVDGAEYALGSTISVSTTVTDPVLPVVSISGPIGVTQGHDYPLTVSLDSAATENLDIAILVSDLARSTDDIVFTGATIAGVTTTGIVVRDADTFTPANGVVQIPSGESSVVVNLTTQESSTSFEGSSITLVTPGAGCEVSIAWECD